LKVSNKPYRSSVEIQDDTAREIQDFVDIIPTHEKTHNLPLVILQDGKSAAFYCLCHISAKNLYALGDPDAVIDPKWQEEFRANRELEPDNFYFLQRLSNLPLSLLSITFPNY
jgi:hypothetical protein